MSSRDFTQATTATSSGTDYITTLSRVAGWPYPADVFYDGELFEYSIFTSDGAPLSVEYGYWDNSNSRIVRQFALTTWDDGTTTFDDTNPTKPTLSNGTTYQIYIVKSACNASPTLFNVDSVSSGVERYTWSTHCEWAGQFQTWTADRVYYGPLKLDSCLTVTSLAVKLSTTGAGSKLRLGIYGVGIDGYIGAKLAETAELDSGTAYATVSGAIAALKLPPGQYITACIGDSSSIRTQAFTYNRSDSTVLGLTTDFYPISYRYESGSSNTLPSTPNATTSAVNVGAGYMPIVYLGGFPS